MKNIKTFIYVTDEEYFQKTFTLERTSVRTKDVYFNLSASRRLKKMLQKKEMTSEINKVVSNNEVVFSSSNAIITTGGVIFGDNIPTSTYKKASHKESKRIKNINDFFEQNAYIERYMTERGNNRDLINWLLDLERALLTGTTIEEPGIYCRLLNALIETPQPIKSESYEENLKQLKKEYSNE